MASVMRNLVTRVTVSAIVGAVVAGGIVWVSQDSVSRGNTGKVLSGYEEQTTLIAGLEGKLDQLLAANASQADLIAAMQMQIETLATGNASLREEISQQSTSVAALEYARLEQSSELATSFDTINASIAALSSDLEALKTSSAPAEIPDFDDILDRMISAVQRLDDLSNSTRAPSAD